MTARKTALDREAAAMIDRITRMLLAQLEVQTQAASALLERAAPERRDEVLVEIAELRGRLVRLRVRVLGAAAPVLVGR